MINCKTNYLIIKIMLSYSKSINIKIHVVEKLIM